MNDKVKLGIGALGLALTLAQAEAAPTVTGPIAGTPHLSPQHFRVSLAERGYTEEEYFVSGKAIHYTADLPLPEDGRITARPVDLAAYTTRILLRRPSDLRRFNGTVLVEWLNVTSGTDAAPDFALLHRQIVREGYAWIGVSAQKAGLDGIAGAPAMAPAIKAADPVRYASLVHPGDAYAYDIFSQAGALLHGAANLPTGLRQLKARRVLAIGESQSAFYLSTYVNAVDPLARVFDGFLIHARGGYAPDLDGVRADRRDPGTFEHLSRIRDDVRVPVMNVQSETDLMVLGSRLARQPDSDRYRLWEIAGAAHADTYLVNAAYQDAEGVEPALLAAALAPTAKLMGLSLAQPMNAGPQQHYVMNAALEHLHRWVREGHAPPRADRLALAGTDAFDLDSRGIARGGIRSPWVDVPAAVLSGIGQPGTGLLSLFGSTRPLPAEALARLYPGGAADYARRFAAATDAAIKAGFLLEADRREIDAVGALSYPAAP